MFDNTDAVSLELLRFRRELAVAPGFDNALREGVERLASFRHQAFAAVRAVVYLDEHDLTLVSAHTPGQRLSEIAAGKLQKGLHPAIVTSIVREVTAALAALQSSGPAAAHGALTADRIILTPERRLCIIEHPLGPALQRLGLSPRALWRDFGLVTLADERGLARIDARNDIVQLGTIALSLLLARTITLDAFEQRLPELLDEFSLMASINPSVFAAPLRVWLEHALQLASHPYRSAADAQEGLKELPAAAQEEDMIIRPLRPPHGGELTTRPALVGAFNDDREVAGRPEPVALPFPASHTALDSGVRRVPRLAVIAAVVAIIALVEAAVIARMSMQAAGTKVIEPAVVIETADPGDTVLLDGKPVGTTPLRLTVNSGIRAIRLVRAELPVVQATPQSTGEAENAARTVAAIERAAAQQRSGGVRVSSPIELKVLEDDKVLGSTADGPIVTTAGSHQFDFINAALGFRVRQTVTIRAGVLTALAITPPMGRVSFNAEPWAQVLIDEKPIGDTPLANVAVAVGEHQVVFRHPQLGERQQVVTVRADAPARVTTSFQR